MSTHKIPECRFAPSRSSEFSDMDMTLHPGWWEIALRLALTVAAGAAVGLNREAGGHSAGFRTTVLVTLAASLAMIQANILLAVAGKTPSSFGNMDYMRLPLGILTGMGFIGGGAILKRGHLVSGVTTAATLWSMTVIGLCFGGGQLILGCIGTALILSVLMGVKWIDLRVRREHHAHVEIAGLSDVPSICDFHSALAAAGYRSNFLRKIRGTDQEPELVVFDVKWDQPEAAGPPIELLNLLHRTYDLRSFEVIAEGMH
jgi:putative Mg2+ transporter-C (MgtC) family protein